MEQQKDINTKHILKFLLPSLAGVALFLVPIRIDGEFTLLVNLSINATKSAMGNFLLPFVLLVLGVSAVCSALGFCNPKLFKGYWARLFNVKIFNLFIRIFAFLIGIMVYFKLGPEFIWSKNTGGMMMVDVVANLIPFFLWAGMFIPLLTEFGLMEFVGNLLRPVMRPIFRIPGRSAVNCSVAWVGSGTMGIVLTNKEFEDGFYTRREAATISASWCVASVAIVYLLSSFLKLANYFPLIYITVIGVGVLINIIICRIPPLSRFSETFYENAPKRNVSEEIPAGHSRLSYALYSATARASEEKENLIKSGLKITGDIWFTLEPIVLAIGTVGTILVEYTPIIGYLALPFEWVVGLLGLPEATLAGQCILLGGVDLFLPFVVGMGLESMVTKFALTITCICQIIFLTETGPLLLKLDMGIKLWHLVALFLIRTLLALLMATPLAFFFFG